MLRAVHVLTRRMKPLLPAGARRRFERAYWDLRWRHGNATAPWIDRPVSAEIVEAVDGGWFDATQLAVDLGCGDGSVSAWLAGRGFSVVGVDFAPAAILLARRTHGDFDGRLEFHVVDVCTGPWPDRKFGVLIDRGCFHQLVGGDREAYADQLKCIASAGARFLLFVKAFRDGKAIGDPRERERVRREVDSVFGAGFSIDRDEVTHLGPDDTLPGMVFWLTRRAS